MDDDDQKFNNFIFVLQIYTYRWSDSKKREIFWEWFVLFTAFVLFMSLYVCTNAIYTNVYVLVYLWYSQLKDCYK